MEKKRRKLEGAARTTIADIKRAMQEPRLAKSVRDDPRYQVVLAAEEPNRSGQPSLPACYWLGLATRGTVLFPPQLQEQWWDRRPRNQHLCTINLSMAAKAKSNHQAKTETPGLR
jgi:hypothetical protein